MKKYKWFLAGAALAAVMALFSWTFGWFGGTIDVMEFSADEVEAVELFQYWLSENKVVVTEQEDIQALMDEVNGFRHTGTMLKYPKKLIPGGGEVWYGITVNLTDGKRCHITLSCLDSRKNLSDVEMQYGRFHTCRGSLELVHALHAKYLVEAPA